MDEVPSGGHQQDQRKLGRLRAGVILRAHIQEWPAIDLGSASVATGPESWASFLEVAGSDDLARASPHGFNWGFQQKPESSALVKGLPERTRARWAHNRDEQRSVRPV